MARTIPLPRWQHAVVVLTYTALIVVTVAALYWAQVVFIPVALALFVAFMLNPLVKRLQQWGAGRIPAVIVSVTLGAVLLGGLLWLVGRQVTGLIGRLPDYSNNIQAKAKSLKEWGAGTVTDRLDTLVNDLNKTLKEDAPGKPGEAVPPTVVVREDKPWLVRASAYLGPTLGWMGGLALVLVLVVFVLLSWEDTRNRLLRLGGEDRLSYSTRALTEASRRISRYLLMQLIINSSYGLILGLGLLALGIDYALLWGFLAAVLRYAPYVGPWLGALFPVALSLAMFETWWQPLAVIGFILVLELISNNFMEPWLYGRSIGVSEVGLLVCAAFWTFLWGPIGLVLSAPLTVCLVILGKYIPALKFFDILLGDKPALSPSVSFYQRLLARDKEEARKLALEQAQAGGAEAIYDTMILPALQLARRDHERGDVDEADAAHVVQETREVLREMDEELDRKPPTAPALPDDERVRLLACPARDVADQATLEMLARMLDPHRWEIEVTDQATLLVEMLEQAAEKEPAVVCIGILGPGTRHARYLCRRLRTRFPDVTLVVVRWGQDRNDERARRALEKAGADEVRTTLKDTANYLNSLLPVLREEQAPARK